MGNCSMVKHARLYHRQSPKTRAQDHRSLEFSCTLSSFNTQLAVIVADRTRRAGCCTCFLAASGTPLSNALLEECWYLRSAQHDSVWRVSA